MARQRKSAKEYRDVSTKPAQSSRHHTKHNKGTGSFSNIITILASILVVVSSYTFYNYYVQTRVITPIGYPEVVAEEPNTSVALKYWGSYRSGLYLGMKTRSAHSLVTGMMWFSQKLVQNTLPIRHWCSQHDSLQSYGWLQHDGINFGIQEIIDGDLKLTTSFVKRAESVGDWTARITVRARNSSKPITTPVSLLFYVATDGHGTITPRVVEESILTSVSGETEDLGKFSMTFVPSAVDGTVIKYNFLSAVAPSGLQLLKETVMNNLVLFQSKGGTVQVLGLVGYSKDPQNSVTNPNFIVYQATFLPPFELEVIYESNSGKSHLPRISGAEYNTLLAQHKKNFEIKFDKTFKLSSKGYSSEDIGIAQAALSNMIGGIGYFYGSSLVQSQYNAQPVNYWEAPLYTAVPSRSYFPRGFLWDEGFHLLLISQWDVEITKDILAHYLNLMNIEGWIPRELILGKEAQARVPAEFIIQKNTNANPPTLFLAFESLLHLMNQQGQKKDTRFLLTSFPRLQAWYNWFNTTQKGNIPGSYRWRGRNAETDKELNPKTLTSGLDDYPRATHPTDEEIHVDLLCWMAYASRVMSRIAEEIGENWMDYASTYRFLSDNRHIDKLHWSSNSQSYCDYGLHSDNVKLVKRQLPPQHPGQPPPPPEKVRQIITKPSLRFVEEFGYVSLFPFLLQLIQPDNPKLSKIISDIRNPKLLWTDYGLRSLSRTSSYYLKYNTEHDPPYWRGPIWINLNFLAVRAAQYYSQLPGPYQEEASELYKNLRKNVVSNILREYKRTGYIWEQYNDKTGAGQGVHPFNGWSALLVLMMAEVF